MTLSESMANIEQDIGEEFYSMLSVGVSSTRDTLKRKHIQTIHRRKVGEALNVISSLVADDFFENIVEKTPESFTVVTMHDFLDYLLHRLEETGLMEKVSEIITNAEITDKDIERSFRHEIVKNIRQLDQICNSILAFLSKEGGAEDITRLLNIYSSMRIAREQMETIQRSNSTFELGKDMLYLLMTLLKISQYINRKSRDDNFLRDIQLLSEISLQSRSELVSDNLNVYELAKSEDT